MNQSVMKQKPDQSALYQMSGNTAYWKGPVYANRKDPRFIVPKRNPSLGWTLNFGHIIIWVAFALILLIAILSALFIK